MTNLSEKYCPANNDRVSQLPFLLTNYPNEVLVRDAFGDHHPLIAIVQAPFHVRYEEGHFVLFGTRVSDGETACLRLIKHNGASVLQWKQSITEAWRFDEGWIPSLMLYIPVDVKVRKVQHV